MSQDIDGTTCTITRGGENVGVLGIAYAEQGRATEALRAAGYGCECAGRVDLKRECTEDDHEVCDLSVALVYAREIAADTGTAAPELDALDAAGAGSKDEVAAAVAALRDRLPQGSDERMEAELLLGDIAGTGTEGTAAAPA